MTEQDLQIILSTAIDYNGSDRRRINHLIKVTGFAQDLAYDEKIGEDDRFTLLAAAMLHDIGAHEAERQYGSADAEKQEELGPDIIRELLEPSDLGIFEIEAICILVRTHHHYGMLENIMHQLLVEADFLVNLDETNASAEEIRRVYDTIFKSESGRKRLKTLYAEAFDDPDAK